MSLGCPSLRRETNASISIRVGRACRRALSLGSPRTEDGEFSCSGRLRRWSSIDSNRPGGDPGTSGGVSEVLYAIIAESIQDAPCVSVARTRDIEARMHGKNSWISG